MSIWQLQEAKNKFSKVVDEALMHGPQIVTRRGVESVVIISKSEYNSLSRKRKSLVDVLMSTPSVELDLSRSKEKIREVQF